MLASSPSLTPRPGGAAPRPATRPSHPAPLARRCGASIAAPPRARPAPPAAQPTGSAPDWFVRAPAAGPVEVEGTEAAGARLALPPSPDQTPQPRRALPHPPHHHHQTVLAAFTAAGLAIPGLSGFDFDGPASVVQALAVLAAIVAVHEAGHFSCARYFGVRVSQFSIGFGPPLVTRTGEDGVEYSLRAIPLGGYVAFPDDDPEADTDPDDPDLLKNRPLLQRAAVISAGVAANLVAAAAVLLTQASTVGVAELDLLPGVAVPRVLAGSPAEAAGVRPGDLIAGINGVPIPASPGAVAGAVAVIQRSGGVPLTLDLVRGDATVRALTAPTLVDGPVTAGKQQKKGGAATTPAAPPPELTRLRLRVTPTGEPASTSSPAGDGRIGIQLATHATVRRVVARDPGTAVSLAAKEYKRLGSAVVNGLVGLASNFGEAARAVAGPVAIVAAGAEVARSDVGGLFQVRERERRERGGGEKREGERGAPTHPSARAPGVAAPFPPNPSHALSLSSLSFSAPLSSLRPSSTSTWPSSTCCPCPPWTAATSPSSPWRPPGAGPSCRKGWSKGSWCRVSCCCWRRAWCWWCGTRSR